MTDLLDKELTTAFDRAHDAPQWAGPTWPDPAARVQRAAARVRVRRAAAAAAGLALVAGGVLAAVETLPAGKDRLVPGDGGNGTASTAPADVTGAKWLLTPNEYNDYTAAHPSPSPSTDRVASPAPSDPALVQLQADIGAALPTGVRTIRADAADGGARGEQTVWLRLADATPVAVERMQLAYPRVLSTTVGTASTEAVAPEHFTPVRTWADGTAYTVVTGTGWGYGMDEQTQWSGPFVWTVTPEGLLTIWTAPVSVDQLLGWAETADANAAGG